jgi:hypothetical protein
MKEVFPVEFPYVPGTDFSGVVEAVGAQAMMLVAERRLRLALEEHPVLPVNREEGVA